MGRCINPDWYAPERIIRTETTIRKNKPQPVKIFECTRCGKEIRVHRGAQHRMTGRCRHCKDNRKKDPTKIKEDPQNPKWYRAERVLRVERAIHKDNKLAKLGRQRSDLIYIFKCSLCNNEIRIRSGFQRHASGLCHRCGRGTIPFRSAYELVRRAAKKKPGDCLSFEEFLNFTRILECHYCEYPIKWERFREKKKVKRCYFLDRKDNIKGYSVDNCVVCCSFCNFAKGGLFSYEEFRLLGPTLRTIWEKRKEEGREYDITITKKGEPRVG